MEDKAMWVAVGCAAVALAAWLVYRRRREGRRAAEAAESRHLSIDESHADQLMFGRPGLADWAKTTAPVPADKGKTAGEGKSTVTTAAPGSATMGVEVEPDDAVSVSAVSSSLSADSTMAEATGGKAKEAADKSSSRRSRRAERAKARDWRQRRSERRSTAAKAREERRSQRSKASAASGRPRHRHSAAKKRLYEDRNQPSVTAGGGGARL